MPSRFIFITWEDDENHSCEEIITAKCIQASHYLQHSIDQHAPTKEKVRIVQGAGPEDWESHYVIIEPERWVIEHSLKCRIAGCMNNCWASRYIEWLLDGPPLEALLGRWKIVGIDNPTLEAV